MPFSYLKQPRHFTDNALILSFLKHANVSIGKEIIPQHGSVNQRLHDATHETRVAQIDQTSKTDGGSVRSGQALAFPVSPKQFQFGLRRSPVMVLNSESK